VGTLGGWFYRTSKDDRVKVWSERGGRATGVKHPQISERREGKGGACIAARGMEKRRLGSWKWDDHAYGKGVGKALIMGRKKYPRIVRG